MKRIVVKSLGFAVVLLLVGCMSLQQRIANNCRRAGFEPGTASFDNCFNASMADDARAREAFGGLSAVGAYRSSGWTAGAR